jgi:hypothetical protein
LPGFAGLFRHTVTSKLTVCYHETVIEPKERLCSSTVSVTGPNNPSGYSGARREDLFADDVVRYPFHRDSFHVGDETGHEAGFAVNPWLTPLRKSALRKSRHCQRQ